MVSCVFLSIPTARDQQSFASQLLFSTSDLSILPQFLFGKKHIISCCYQFSFIGSVDGTSAGTGALLTFLYHTKTRSFWKSSLHPNDENDVFPPKIIDFRPLTRPPRWTVVVVKFRIPWRTWLPGCGPQSPWVTAQLEDQWYSDLVRDLIVLLKITYIKISSNILKYHQISKKLNRGTAPKSSRQCLCSRSVHSSHPLLNYHASAPKW